MYKKGKAYLTSSEIQDLRIITQMDEWKTIIKFIAGLVDLKKKEVLAVNLNEKTFAQLAIIKAKYDGALYVYEKLFSELDKILYSK